MIDCYINLRYELPDQTKDKPDDILIHLVRKCEDKEKQARGDVFKKREIRISLNPRPSAFSIQNM